MAPRYDENTPVDIVYTKLLGEALAKALQLCGFSYGVCGMGLYSTDSDENTVHRGRQNRALIY
jgi:hypothetical protein